MGHEPIGNLLQLTDAHKKNQRSNSCGNFRPVNIGAFLGRIFMTGNKSDGRCMISVGQWDAGVGGNSNGGSHPGYNLKGNTVLCLFQGFLASSAKDQRVPALVSHNRQPLLCLLKDEAIDALLGQSMVTTFFPNVYALGMGVRNFKKGFIGKVVIDQNIRSPDAIPSFHREKAWISRSRPDQIDLALSVTHFLLPAEMILLS